MYSILRIGRHYVNIAIQAPTIPSLAVFR
jgi:hypothetical protein